MGKRAMIKEIEEDLLSRLEDKIVEHFSCDDAIASKDAVEILGLVTSIRVVTRWNKVIEVMEESLHNLVRQIVGFNRAWHRAQNLYGKKHAFSTAARDRKSAIQVKLLRNYSDQVWLERHDYDGSEELYSVCLAQPVLLRSGERKYNAEHLPKRIAEEILTEEELEKFIRTTGNKGEIK